MGERTHTPGPWLLELDNFGDYTVLQQHETLAIAAVVNGEMRRMGGLSDQHEANANLIAAAPDMFAGIEEARSQAEMLLLAVLEGDPRNELTVRVNDILETLRKASPHV